MTPLTRSTICQPAAHLAEHVRLLTASRTHRGTVSGWLTRLGLSDAGQLLDALAGPTPTSTSLLITEHHQGCPLAAKVLLGAKSRMLAAVSRHASGEDPQDRFHTTVAAFLDHALIRADVNSEHLDAQLYWITLRTVSRKRSNVARAEMELHTCIAGPDVVANADTYITVYSLLEWAHNARVINDVDRRAFMLRFCGERPMPVRQVAAMLGVSEDSLESRLRRALHRLRKAVVERRDDMESACMAHYWTTQDLPLDDGASPAQVA
ncbi:sigma factor-like helix-turn-helix DNA-binding protein [Mycolicibacterium sp. XJ870]